MSRENPYDAFMMDHIKNARNYRVISAASHTASGINPLCGDELNVYIQVTRALIEDVAFQCACCGISMASASVMTECVKGKDVAAARALASGFIAALNGDAARARGLEIAQLSMLDAVQELPGRRRCTALAWITLAAALDGRPQAIAPGLSHPKAS